MCDVQTSVQYKKISTWIVTSGAEHGERAVQRRAVRDTGSVRCTRHSLHSTHPIQTHPHTPSHVQLVVTADRARVLQGTGRCTYWLHSWFAHHIPGLDTASRQPTSVRYLLVRECVPGKGNLTDKAFLQMQDTMNICTYAQTLKKTPIYAWFNNLLGPVEHLLR